MDFLTFRTDEERLAKIETGRRRDDSLNTKALDGDNKKLPKSKSVKSYISEEVSFEEWKNNIPKQLDSLWQKERSELHKNNVKSAIGLPQPVFVPLNTQLNTNPQIRKPLTEEVKRKLKELSIKINKQSVIDLETKQYTQERQVA